MVLLSIVKLYEVLWDVIKPYKVFWNVMKHNKAFRNVMKLWKGPVISYDSLWSIVRCYEALLWNILKSTKPLVGIVKCYFMKYYEMLWRFMSKYKLLWHIIKCSKCYESLRGTFIYFLKVYEALWDVMKHFKALWNVM